MKDIKRLIFTILLSFALSFTAAAGTQFPGMQGKPPERPREREKDPPRRDPPKPRDDKREKPKKPDYQSRIDF